MKYEKKQSLFLRKILVTLLLYKPMNFGLCTWKYELYGNFFSF